MPRQRKLEHRGLPARWRFLHGAYRYQVPPGQEHAWDGKKQFTLGRTLSEAYKVWSERVGRIEDTSTVAELLDRYARDVIPQKAAATQLTDRRRLKTVRARFGHAAVQPGPLGIKPHHVYEYVSKNMHRLTSAHREMELLSHAFTMAVNWGLIHVHPFKGEVRFDRTLAPQPAERYVEDWEVVELLSLEPKQAHRAWGLRMVQAYVRIKLLTGLRKTDLLWLPAQHGADGMQVHASKTRHSSGVRQLYTWTPELRAAVDMARATRPVDITPWLFCGARGQRLIGDDNRTAPFDRIWNRAMHRALAETELAKAFAERDLRAKVATDAESLERAQALLGHADARITKRVYIRKPVAVLPARGVE